MVRNIVLKFFDIRKGEFRIASLMFGYIFLVIAVLLIVKPTVNALFLTELGAEQLPFGFLLVAGAAVLSSFVYSRLLNRFRLKTIIEATLMVSAVLLLLLSALLLLGGPGEWMLYFFYTWVAIYAVLSASQFWVLANLVFNVRDAKRLFGLIGSGAIAGGIMGGYLTSLLAPLIGNEFMIVIAVVLLLGILPILNIIWREHITQLNEFKSIKRKQIAAENPLRLIRKSSHLSNLALLVGVSVLVAKLVDYLFSDYASVSIEDPDELSSFFGFWFSTFNLISLAVQLFLTHRIVGIWGVGFSLLLLPLGVMFSSVFFLLVPELSAVVVIKAMDGILKQSVNKSAFELLALPLPFELKNKTKSFIDVVVDSVATGLAGLVLIFLIKGFDLSSVRITWLVLAMVVLWAYLISRVRSSYYKTFRDNLQDLHQSKEPSTEALKSFPVVEGMRKVFQTGSEGQILFMLSKLSEVSDRRFAADVRNLLDHPSIKVKREAIKNLYFLDTHTMPANLNALLQIGDPDLSESVMDYILLHTRNDTTHIFEEFLDHPDAMIADMALLSLVKESVGNERLKLKFRMEERLSNRFNQESGPAKPWMLKAVGIAGITKYYVKIDQALGHGDPALRVAAIEAAGLSMDPSFVEPLVGFLKDKRFRAASTDALLQYGPGILPYLVQLVKDRNIPIEQCRFIPMVIARFGSQKCVRYLFDLFDDVDLSIRLESVKALTHLRAEHPQIKFNRFKVISKIYEECNLYHLTMSAMHTQIIISYRNKRKTDQETFNQEKEARASLLELLERRLDSGLERIFRLLGLKYPLQDILLAYQRLKSSEEEARSKAIDFLDNLLTGNLKQRLLPIIEEAATDLSSEEALQQVNKKIPTEYECFQLLLGTPDLKLKLAVLYLIKIQADSRYAPLLKELANSDDPKLKSFASEALAKLN